jgi:hypothetical protein
MGDHLSNQDSARFKIFSSMTEMPLRSACVCFSLVVSCVFVSGLLRRNIKTKKASSARGQEKKIKTKKLIFNFFNIYKKIFKYR